MSCFIPEIDYRWANANLPRLAACLSRQLYDGHHLDDPVEFERLAFALQRERAAIEADPARVAVFRQQTVKNWQ